MSKHNPITATRIIFFAHGGLLAAWAPLIPLVKTRLELGEGQLSLLLLGIGIGGLITMPFIGLITAKWGIRSTFYPLFLGMAAVFPLLSVFPNFVIMLLGLIFFGAMVGGADIAMNIHAVKVEESSTRPLMSGFHGMWSLGGFAGALSMSIILSLGINPFLASLTLSVIAALLGLSVYGSVYNLRAKSEEPLFVLPKGIIVYLGLLCFMLYLSEHAILDWSGVFLTTIREIPPTQSGFGFALFSLAMVLGRFTGDQLRAQFGDGKILFIGGLMGGIGFAALSFIPNIALNYLALFIIGLGLSNLVPILFSFAGRTKIMPSHLAVTAVATISHMGILFGPPLIGWIAEGFGLQAAFRILALMMLFLAVNFPLLKRS